jgi:ethylbenzene dehydrogenase
MAEKPTRGQLLATAGGAAVFGAAWVAIWKSGGDLPPIGDRVVARRVGEVPADDPGAPAWDDASAVRFWLTPQTITNPKLESLQLADVTVRALHDGTTLGLRVDWEDPSADDLVALATFQDAVAVQLPAKAAAKPPPVSMGTAGQAVHIMQWRSTWQRDIDAGRRMGVADVFPRVVHDVTPDALLGDQAVVYYPGRAVGNTLSVDGRTTPVEEAVAEGFGTLTPITPQRALGRGVHSSSGWRVAMGVPLDRGPAAEPVAPGSSWPIAIAVWLGDRGNRGSRKQYSNWATLEVAA